MIDARIWSAPWVEALGWSLLHSLWQAVLIAVCYSLAHSTLRRSSAALRASLGQLALLSMLLAPATTMLWLLQRPLPQLIAANVGAADWSMSVNAPSDGATIAPLAGLVLAWGLGVVLLTARALWRWRGLRATIARALPVDPVWQRRLASLALRYRVTRPVRWLESAEVAGPVLFGWLRPVVLVPAGLCLRMPAEQLELLLAHELAHIQRADFLANLLQLVVETLLFFNPAMHWVAARLRHDRELACDERVGQHPQQRLTYARALLTLAEQRQASRLVLAASGGLLLDRVRRLVDDERAAQPRIAGRLLGMLLVAATLAWLGQSALRAHWPTAYAPISAVLIESLRQVGARPAANDALQVDGLPIELLRLPAVPPSLPAAESPLALPAIRRSGAPDRMVATADLASAPTRLAEPMLVAQGGLDTGSDSLPPVLHRQLPEYPRAARLAGRAGWVELSYRIGRNGEVADIEVVQAQPAGEFEQAAREALQQWRFAAADDGGSWRSLRFDFTPDAVVEPARNSRECVLPTGTRICRNR